MLGRVEVTIIGSTLSHNSRHDSPRKF